MPQDQAPFSRPRPLPRERMPGFAAGAGLPAEKAPVALIRGQARSHCAFMRSPRDCVIAVHYTAPYGIIRPHCPGRGSALSVPAGVSRPGLNGKQVRGPSQTRPQCLCCPRNGKCAQGVSCSHWDLVPGRRPARPAIRSAQRTSPETGRNANWRMCRGVAATGAVGLALFGSTRVAVRPCEVAMACGAARHGEGSSNNENPSSRCGSRHARSFHDPFPSGVRAGAGRCGWRSRH